MEFEFTDVSLLKKRYIQDELNYIWDYCKRTGFIKYIKTEQDAERLKKYIIHYGFTTVQEGIRKIHRRKELKYPLHILWQEMQKLIVTEEELMMIPAYRDAMIDKYNKQLKEELLEHEFNMLTKTYVKNDTYKSFNNFEERDRSQGNNNGYMTYEEMETRLLGWE